MAEVQEPRQEQQSQPRGQQIQEQARNTSSGKQLRQPSPQMLSPFEEMNRIMDRIFEGMWPRNWMPPFSLGLERPPLASLSQTFEVQTPKVDVINRDEDILIKAEVPGVNKEDLQVSVTENTLTIHGETRHEETREAGEYYRRELSRGAFSRTLTLPGQVDGSKAKATFRNGILELTLPKVEKSQRHTIPIE